MITPSTLRWLQYHMPVVAGISKTISPAKPLAGIKIAVIFHLTDPVAYMLLVLKEAGANIFFIPSKKETIIPSALEILGQIGIYYKNPASSPEREKCLKEILDFKPNLIIDNADLFKLWHQEKNPPPVWGATVHSRSAYDIVENYSRTSYPIHYPIIGVGASKLKLELESTLGTGQSVINAMIAVAKLQLSGKKIAIVGYGNVGNGIARMASAMGARVLIVEIQPYRALKAALLNGYQVVSLEEAAACADVLLTATGHKDVLTEKYLACLKDRAFIGNVGRYREIDIPALEKMADSTNRINQYVTEYKIGVKYIYLMTGGEQLNHIAGEGNTSEIMDISLALHILSMVYLQENRQNLTACIHPVPASITEKVAAAKLHHLGVHYEIPENTVN